MTVDTRQAARGRRREAQASAPHAAANSPAAGGSGVCSISDSMWELVSGPAVVSMVSERSGIPANAANSTY